MINRYQLFPISLQKYRERLIFHNLVEIRRAQLAATNLKCIIWARKAQQPRCAPSAFESTRIRSRSFFLFWIVRSCKLLRNVDESSRDIFASSFPFLNFVEKIYSLFGTCAQIEWKISDCLEKISRVRVALFSHFVRFNRPGNLDFHQASSFQVLLCAILRIFKFARTSTERSLTLQGKLKLPRAKIVLPTLR